MGVLPWIKVFRDGASERRREARARGQELTDLIKIAQEAAGEFIDDLRNEKPDPRKPQKDRKGVRRISPGARQRPHRGDLLLRDNHRLAGPSGQRFHQLRNTISSAFRDAFPSPAPERDLIPAVAAPPVLGRVEAHAYQNRRAAGQTWETSRWAAQAGTVLAAL